MELLSQALFIMVVGMLMVMFFLCLLEAGVRIVAKTVKKFEKEETPDDETVAVIALSLQ